MELRVQQAGSRGGQEMTEVVINELAVEESGTWRQVEAGLSEAGRWRTPLAADGALVQPTPEGLHVGFQPTSNFRIIVASYPEAIPALTTGGTQPQAFGLPVVGVDDETLPVRIVNQASALPGVSTVGAVVDYELADRVAVGVSERADYQVWVVAGAADRITPALEAAGIRVVGEQRAADLAARFGSEGPGLALRLLLAIATAAALLAAGATAVELHASSRRRTYELAALEAVGAKRRSLRSALLVEHLMVLGTAAIVGPASGIVSAELVISKVPAFSELPATPPLRYLIDTSAIALTAGLAIALAAVAAVAMTVAIQRGARAERLRDAPT